MRSGEAGDDGETAFTRLYDQHRRALHAYLLGRTGDAETARDVLQETFLRLWRHFSATRTQPPERQRAWVFGVARNLVIDMHRHRKSRDSAYAALQAAAETTAPASEEPEARAELAERVRLVEDAVRGLPEDQRVVVALHAMGNLTSAQIAELLGEPAGTVRYRLSLARRRLAEALSPAALAGDDA